MGKYADKYYDMDFIKKSHILEFIHKMPTDIIYGISIGYICHCIYKIIIYFPAGILCRGEFCAVTGNIGLKAFLLLIFTGIGILFLLMHISCMNRDMLSIYTGTDNYWYFRISYKISKLLTKIKNMPKILKITLWIVIIKFLWEAGNLGIAYLDKLIT